MHRNLHVICSKPLPLLSPNPPAMVMRGARVTPMIELKTAKAPIFMGRVSGV